MPDLIVSDRCHSHIVPSTTFIPGGLFPVPGQGIGWKRGEAINDIQAPYNDQSALRAAAAEDVALCTIVGIEGSFSRRLGAQLAVGPNGAITGSLSDGCLEHELASEAEAARADGQPRLMRYGQGSPKIDFRLPCGSGLDILIDPSPDRVAIRAAVARLDDRKQTSLQLPLPSDAAPGLLAERDYIPALRIVVFGEGPEMTSLAALAVAMGLPVEAHARQGHDGGKLALGRAPDDVAIDPWSAIVLLFHDHEWEAAILKWAVDTPAFYIGAQGGKAAREARVEWLRAQGCDDAALARIQSPIGLIGRARDPAVLGLSVLAEIVGQYEAHHR